MNQDMVLEKMFTNQTEKFVTSVFCATRSEKKCTWKGSRSENTELLSRIYCSTQKKKAVLMFTGNGFGD